MATASQLTVTDYDALLVDLDGVATRTADVHAAAWKEMLDAYLSRRAKQEDRSFEPFELQRD